MGTSGRKKEGKEKFNNFSLTIHTINIYCSLDNSNFYNNMSPMIMVLAKFSLNESITLANSDDRVMLLMNCLIVTNGYWWFRLLYYICKYIYINNLGSRYVNEIK